MWTQFQRIFQRLVDIEILLHTSFGTKQPLNAQKERENKENRKSSLSAKESRGYGNQPRLSFSPCLYASHFSLSLTLSSQSQTPANQHCFHLSLSSFFVIHWQYTMTAMATMHLLCKLLSFLFTSKRLCFFNSISTCYTDKNKYLLCAHNIHARKKGRNEIVNAEKYVHFHCD